MTLQILIPHYKENPQDIKPLLDSIAIQQSIEFKNLSIAIGFDGQESIPLPEQDWKNFYPFNIQFLHLPHQGVSATRNALLDNSEADFVMFCDADDMFCHACGLYIIFQQMKRDFDTLVSCFVQESRLPNKNVIYINHDMDSTFVHGKVHKKSYLIDNNIRFNPNLIIHEDSYFNILAQNLTLKAKYCNVPFYLWKWRENSICRHDPDYILKTYNNMLDSNDALIDEFEKRRRKDKAEFYVGFMIFDAYYTMNKKEWLNKTNKPYRDSVEKRFAEYYKKHKKQWNNIKDEEKMAISNGIRTRSIGQGMPMETITIDAWLKHISKIGKGGK